MSDPGPVAPQTPAISVSTSSRSVADVIRWTIAIVLALILGGALWILGIFLFQPELGEELTGGLLPPQYYADLDAQHLTLSGAQYQSAWAVAHNSGDDISAVLDGLLHGADIIEMDVVEMDGQLYSSHDTPLPWVGPRWFRGPSLQLIWASAGQARGFMMDLKQNDRAFVAQVAEFINTNGKGRPIFVASRNPAVLRQLSVQAPEALLLMSVPDRGSLNDLLSNYPLVDLVDGVTIRQSVIDDQTAAVLNGNDLMIFAWVVNDLKRVNELLELGVDGITSDNLAILELVGGEAIPEAGTNPGGATPAATPGTLPDPPSASPAAQ